MNRIYKKPLSEIVDLSVKFPVMGTGDAAGSTVAKGKDGWANEFFYEQDDTDITDTGETKKSLWED